MKRRRSAFNSCLIFYQLPRRRGVEIYLRAPRFLAIGSSKGMVKNPAACDGVGDLSPLFKAEKSCANRESIGWPGKRSPYLVNDGGLPVAQSDQYAEFELGKLGRRSRGFSTASHCVTDSNI